MIKKHNLVLMTLMLVGFFTLFTANIFAQKTDPVKSEQSTQPCSGDKFVMPGSISAGNELFANYLKVASLPIKERRIAFAAFSNEQKASFFRVQFALQLIKHPDLTNEQTDFILEAISKTSADIYDKSDPEKVNLNEKIGQDLELKAMSIFEPKKAAGILAAIFSNKDEDIALLQGYEDLLKSGMQQRKKIAKEMPTLGRVNIWKTQLVYHLATSSLNDKQKRFIVDLMPNIQSILDASSNLSKEEKTKYVDALEGRMLAVFTKAEAYAIFMTIGIQKMDVGIQKIDTINGGIEPEGTWCNCRWYCSVGTCRTINCVIFPDCGPFGTWECTAVCVG